MKLIIKKEQCKTKKFLGKGFKDIHLQLSYIIEFDAKEIELLDKYEFWDEIIDIKNTNTENLNIKNLKEGIILKLDRLNDIITAESNAHKEADALKKLLDCISKFDKKEIIEY